jgi:hypothetical protein
LNRERKPLERDSSWSDGVSSGTPLVADKENQKEIEMREQKRSMRPHEKGLAALYAFLIGIITLCAIRHAGWFKQKKSE